jgi:hypothetical protein
MVAPAPRESLSWLSPSPMWRGIGDLGQEANRTEFLRPAILRFGHDSFMDELLAALAYHPERLGEWRAVAETWEKPMRTPPTAARLALTEPVSVLSVQRSRRRGIGATGSVALTRLSDTELAKPLKLYQPAQLRHYLVSASLVCQRPGLPDRRIDPGKQERAAFVLRRILLPEGDTKPAADPRAWDEHAFIQGEKGPHWQPAKDAEGRAGRLLPDEERLPLFSVGYDETPGRRRRVFAGTIPLGRREAYVAAGVQTGTATGGGAGAGSEPATDPRRLLFQMQVTGPWSELVQQMLDESERRRRPQPTEITTTFGNPPLPPPASVAEAVKRAREQAQTISWYALLDLERFLFNHVPRVHEVLAGSRSRSALDAQTEEPLLAGLESFTLHPALQTGPTNLLQVLTLLAGNPSIGNSLEQVDVTYESSGPDVRWPTFFFPLADVLDQGPFPFTVGGIDLSGPAASRDATLARADNALKGLADLVEQALPPGDGVAMPEIHIQARPQFDTRAAWFAIRCVYERPNCGPFDPPVVSEPTRPFQVAGFFDPDAPARPVRIPMPFDISPAGLRKFPKGTTLMISDMLCGQLKKIRRLTLGDLVLSVLPWPFHKDLPDPGATGPCRDGDSFGMFCSLSIPIVTLCALILLIILVLLFDLFFHWLPLLFFCFPIKLLSGKQR